MRLASTLLGFPLVATILIALIRGTRHLSEGWPTHAEHHLVVGIVLAVGLSVVGLVILAKPLQHAEPWAWWAMLVSGLAIFGSFWIGHAAVGLGDSATVPNTAQAVLSALYLIGLVQAGTRVFEARRPDPDRAVTP